MATLISFMGGPTTTEAHLDTMFKPGLKTTSVGSGGNNGVGTTIFNPGNEPSFFTPFLYNYLQGRQWKSVLRSGEVVNQDYLAAPSGLPGNSDAGAIDSWMIWNMLGLYPVVTQPVYLLLSPWFSDVTLRTRRSASRRRTSATPATSCRVCASTGRRGTRVGSATVTLWVDKDRARLNLYWAARRRNGIAAESRTPCIVVSII